jgi:hypothetical protein
VSALRYPATLLASVALSTAAPPPSDPVGIYGVIDRVVFEGSSGSPTAVQIWGTFALSDQKPGDHYLPPVRGYLYFVPSRGIEAASRREWADLQSVAGTKNIVGFAAKWQRQRPGRVRCPAEKPANPDTYTLGFGVVKMPQAANTGWEVARKLLSGSAPTAACGR